jgi:hypothetical protein
LSAAGGKPPCACIQEKGRRLEGGRKGKIILNVECLMLNSEGQKT